MTEDFSIPLCCSRNEKVEELVLIATLFHCERSMSRVIFSYYFTFVFCSAMTEDLSIPLYFSRNENYINESKL